MIENIQNQSNSGAEISITKIKNEIVLNKKVYFAKKNEKIRILEQLNKQNLWHNDGLVRPFFSVPVKHEIFNKFISMNMPFIYGYSGSDILTFNSYRQSNNLAKNLIKLISFFKNKKSKFKFIDNQKIIQKINIVENKSNKNFKIYFKKLKKKFHYIPDNLETTFCHGDLTLSNMIFTNNKKNNFKFNINRNLEIYLVDWLDSSFETYFLDLAKLKQDLFYGWSSRNLNTNQIISNSITGKFVWSLIEEKFINNKNIKIFNFFMNLCILRILPYTKSYKDFIWLKKVLDLEG
ncbi:hypothetical protein OAI94_00325 [bacterium]|nr:hypothetical protein [bacterium]